MKKLLVLLLIGILALGALTACGEKKEISEDETTQTEATEKPTTEKEETKSTNKSYKNINEKSKPVGVYDIEVTENTTYSWSTVTGKMIKNSNSPEESKITITFRAFDENDKYLGEIEVNSSRSLSEGDVDVFEEYNSWIKNAKRVEVSNIEETDIAEAEKEEAFNRKVRELDMAMYDKKYNLAETLIEELKEEFPDKSKEIKKIEAVIADELEVNNEEE